MTKYYYFECVYADNVRMFKYNQRGFIRAQAKDEARKIWNEKYPEGYKLTMLFSVESQFENEDITTL